MAANRSPKTQSSRDDDGLLESGDGFIVPAEATVDGCGPMEGVYRRWQRRQGFVNSIR